MEGMSGMAASLTAWGGAVVGVVFLWAAVAKAVAPHLTIQHLLRLQLVPTDRTAVMVQAGIGLEAAMGAALIAGLAPSITLPLTGAILLAFAGFTRWSTRTGRAEDCGCYGTALMVTPAQSIALNALYFALVLAAWLVGAPRPALSGTPASLIAIGIGVSAAGLAVYATRYPQTHGKLLYNPNPLRLGRRWKAAWAAGALKTEDPGEALVVYLGPKCPHCQRWVRFLNAATQVTGLPRVVGVVAVPDQEREAFAAANGIRFPLVRIPEPLMQRLAGAVPTTALVEDGTTRRVWLGAMPPEFTDRFARALFSHSVPPGASANGTNA